MNDKNLFFIQHKISTIRSALFFNGHNGNPYTATSIISALKMDENGGIWFFLNNDAHLQATDEVFPARLYFYRKGIPFSVNIYGKAEVIRDLRYMSELAGINLNNCPEIAEKLVVIKVSTDAAEYHEWHAGKAPPIRMPKLIRFLNKLFHHLFPSYEHAPAQYIFN